MAGRSETMSAGGNRCGHNPAKPRLRPTHPIRSGKGGLPRILSLAAERAKTWYRHPAKCPPLRSASRQTRSERREAVQIIIETVLSFLDLASLCLGTPTLDNGFVDVDMQSIIRVSGMGQRRCERAIAALKKAGLMEVRQPRAINDQGDYVGLRAIRVVTSLFFECLGLLPMLQRERARASERLRRKAMRANKRLSDLMNRLTRRMRCTPRRPDPQPEQREEETRRWNTLCLQLIQSGVDPPEAKRLVNARLGHPPDYSPGYAASPRRAF